MKHLRTYNESIRDHMKPKSEEDMIESFKDNSTYINLKKIESILKDKFGDKIITKFGISKRKVGPRSYERYLPVLYINSDDNENYMSIGVGGDYESSYGLILWGKMQYNCFESWDIDGVIENCVEWLKSIR